VYWQDIHASEFNLFIASVFTVSQDKDSWIQFSAQHFIASSMTNRDLFDLVQSLQMIDKKNNP